MTASSGILNSMPDRGKIPWAKRDQDFLLTHGVHCNQIHNQIHNHLISVAPLWRLGGEVELEWSVLEWKDHLHNSPWTHPAPSSGYSIPTLLPVQSGLYTHPPPCSDCSIHTLLTVQIGPGSNTLLQVQYSANRIVMGDKPPKRLFVAVRIQTLQVRTEHGCSTVVFG